MQTARAIKKIKVFAKNHIGLIIAGYLVLIIVLLAIFSIKTAFSPLWMVNNQDPVLDDIKIDNNVLQSITEKINNRSKAFSDIENLEFKNPFD